MIPLPHDVVFGYATAGAGTLAPFLQTGGTAEQMDAMFIQASALKV